MKLTVGIASPFFLFFSSTQNDQNMLVEELGTPDDKQDVAIINTQPMEEEQPEEKIQVSADNC